MKAFIRLNKKTREIKEITLNKHKTFNINILYLMFYLISSLFPQLIAIYYILPQDIAPRANRRQGVQIGVRHPDR